MDIMTEINKPEPIEDVITRWKSTGDKQDSGKILTYLKPVMDSAITSFAGGDKSLRVAAARTALDAMRTYDPVKKTDPKTHAYNHLQRLGRIAGARTNIIHIPENVSREYAAVNKARLDYEDIFGREPSDTELSDYVGIPVKRLNKIERYGHQLSESQTYNEEGEDTIGFKMIPDNVYLDYLYSSVDDIDRKILESTTGYNKRPILSQNELARRLRITPAAVSQRMSRLRYKLELLREKV